MAAGGEEAQAQRGRGALSGLVERGQFVGEFGVDLLAVVEVVGERGVDFGGREMRVLADDFLGGPTVAEMIGDDLCDADARQAFEPRGIIGSFANVWIVEDRHTEPRIARARTPATMRWLSSASAWNRGVGGVRRRGPSAGRRRGQSAPRRGQSVNHAFFTQFPTSWERVPFVTLLMG